MIELFVPMGVLQVAFTLTLYQKVENSKLILFVDWLIDRLLDWPELCRIESEMDKTSPLTGRSDFSLLFLLFCGSYSVRFAGFGSTCDYNFKSSRQPASSCQLSVRIFDEFDDQRSVSDRSDTAEENGGSGEQSGTHIKHKTRYARQCWTGLGL